MLAHGKPLLWLCPSCEVEIEGVIDADLPLDRCRFNCHFCGWRCGAVIMEANELIREVRRV